MSKKRWRKKYRELEPHYIKLVCSYSKLLDLYYQLIDHNKIVTREFMDLQDRLCQLTAAEELKTGGEGAIIH